MKIQGRFAHYDCIRAEHGWSYMTVKVRKIIPVCVFGRVLFSWKLNVWTSSGSRPRHAYDAAKYLPHQCREWFSEVVAEYERHHEAWSAEIAQ